jgi:hypothetical protein
MTEVTAMASIHNIRTDQPHSVTKSQLETCLLNLDILDSWQIPPFQRRLRVNEKVREIADELCVNGGIVNGIITLGRLPNDPVIYLVDAQHRREAMRLSGLPEFIADVRTKWFATMAEMAEEYRKLNSPIVRMKADDTLRAMEYNSSLMQQLHAACPFIGYDFIKSGSSGGPIVGMSSVLRCWRASGYDTPSMGTGASAARVVEDLTTADIQQLIDFLKLAYNAWGSEPENYRLWGALNLMMCMWLCRVLVIDNERMGGKRYLVLTPEQFRRCLMRVSADRNYIDWLQGRKAGERDRAPCYARLRSLVVRCLHEDNPNQNLKMPKPAWATTGVHKR